MEIDEELVRRISEQVLAKLNQEKSVQQEPGVSQIHGSKQSVSTYDSVIILLCGGDMELEEVYRQIAMITSRYSNIYIVMTKSATQIIGIPKIRSISEGGTIITEYTQEFHEKVLPFADALYVPVLSLNTGAKVAALNADSLGTVTMVFALMNGVPVVAAKNSLYCCQKSPENIPPPIIQRIGQIINQLREIGVMVLDIRELSRDVPVQKVPSTGIPYTVSSAGKEVANEYTAAYKILVNGGASRIGVDPGQTNFDQALAGYIDHTVLKADATEEEIQKLCEEAKEYEFASVCVNPTNVKLAKSFLQNSPVKVCTVIGFPLGATTPTVKAIETRDAVANGAEEVDMVINVGALKSGNDDLVKRDIEAVVQAAEGKALVKVILETALLSKEEIIKGSLLSKLGGADFVKTSTGFSTAGALVEDVALMRETVGPEMGIKAAGGIRTHEAAEEMIKAGATRIGASASVSIVKGTSSSDEKY
jgi:deoxyribose-phosphate aldolase